MAFRDSGGRSLGLVYLYKRGTFYPFAPLSGERRDNALELQIRGVLGADLKIEPDLAGGCRSGARRACSAPRRASGRRGGRS